MTSTALRVAHSLFLSLTLFLSHTQLLLDNSQRTKFKEMLQSALEKKKLAAVQSEDYETAAKLKKQIEELRVAAQKAAEAAQAAQTAKKAEAAKKAADAAKAAKAAKAQAARAAQAAQAAKRLAEQIATLEKKKLAAAKAEEYEQAAKYKKEIEMVRPLFRSPHT